MGQRREDLAHLLGDAQVQLGHAYGRERAQVGLDHAHRVHQQAPADPARPPLGGAVRSGALPVAATQMVFSIARARTIVTQCSSLNGPCAQAAVTANICAPASTSARASSGNRMS